MPHIHKFCANKAISTASMVGRRNRQEWWRGKVPNKDQIANICKWESGVWMVNNKSKYQMGWWWEKGQQQQQRQQCWCRTQKTFSSKKPVTTFHHLLNCLMFLCVSVCCIVCAIYMNILLYNIMFVIWMRA